MAVFALEMFLAKSEGCAGGLKDGHTLMRPIFELLKRCEDAGWKLEEKEEEEEAGGSGVSGAYAVDLLLSCALAVMDSPGQSPESSAGAAVNPELLVRCLNACVDPGTRGTALLVLAKACAAGDADYVIQNSVPIFTFMGSHFLRMDSRHSFEVACTAIDIIIPHIQKVSTEH